MSAYKHPPFSACAGFTVSRCIGTCLRTYPPIGGLPPARAKYAEHKRSLCDGCISLSNAEGFVRCFLHLPQLAFAFHFGRIRPLFLPVSGLIFSLTTNRLLLSCLLYSGILTRTYSRSPQYGVPTKYHSLARFISIRVFTH